MITPDNDKLNSMLDKFPKFFRGVFGTIGKMKWSSVWKYIVIVASTLFMINVYNFFNDKNTVKLVERALIKSNKEERESIEKEDSTIYSLSDQVEANVDKEVEKLMVELDADRVVVPIFHDNIKMNSKLHFKFFSECYEKLDYDDGAQELAEDFQGVRTSLFPLYSYLSSHKIFISNLEDIKSIDMRYAHRMEEYGYDKVGFYFLRSESGEEIGVLCVEWLKNTRKTIPSDQVISDKLKKYGIKLESLLDLKTYKIND